MKKFLLLSVFFLFALNYSNAYLFVPYQGVTKKIVTEHFVILFPAKYKDKALKVAGYAEEIHSKLKDFMKWEPILRTVLVLSDETDSPNGVTVPLIRNTIYLYLVPSDLEKTLKEFEDPLYSLIVHEYTHLLHLDQIRGAAWFWRAIYGKLYCPNTGSFRWYMEGTAVLSESINSKGGRLKSSYNEAIIEAVARAKAIPSFDTIVSPVVDWPYDESIYNFGARFMEYLYDTYGKEKFQEFFIDISDDFWPFIFMFVVKFKKVYGKSLGELWTEWKDFEEKKVNYNYIQNNENQPEKLTGLQGEITGFARGKDYFLISSYSYKNDKYLYKLSDNGKLEKLRLGNFNSISTTNNERYILCTTMRTYYGGYIYSDLYCFDMKTKFLKPLTYEKRINYVSFSKNTGQGVFVSHDGISAKIFKAKFNDGNIKNVKEIKLRYDFEYIDEPSIDDNGEKVVFSARLKNNNYGIYLLDLKSENLELIADIRARYVKFVDTTTISFVAKEEKMDTLFVFNFGNKEIKKVLKKYLDVLNGIIINSKVYFIDYTYLGEELFTDERIDQKTDVDFNPKSSELAKDQKDSQENGTTSNYKITDYTGFRFIYPRVWAIIPYQLDSYYIWSDPKAASLNNPFFHLADNFYGFSMPAPQAIFYNVWPQARFSYLIKVGFDYMKLYPDNSVALNWKLPFIDVSYQWENHLGGQNNIVDNNLYPYLPGGIFPEIFNNTLSLSTTIPLGIFSELAFFGSAYHTFEQYDADYNKLVNFLSFDAGVEFSFIAQRLKSARWDRGFYFNLEMYLSPALLDNTSFQIFRTNFSGRVPAGSIAFFFTDVQAGVEPHLYNIFSVNTSIFKISENILGYSYATGPEDISIINLKAFPSQITNLYNIGSSFVSTDLGFDFSVYKKTKYWHALTFGIDEFYIKTYGEFAYLNNVFSNSLNGIYFDGVLELGLDLFAIYGNLSMGHVLGGAVGYNVGNNKIGWNVYYYINFSL